MADDSCVCDMTYFPHVENDLCVCDMAHSRVRHAAHVHNAAANAAVYAATVHANNAKA